MKDDDYEVFVKLGMRLLGVILLYPVLGWQTMLGLFFIVATL